MPKVGQQPSLSQQSPPQSRIPCQLLALQKPLPAVSAAPFGMQKPPPGASAALLGTKTPFFGGWEAFRPEQASPLIVPGSSLMA
jgi:hypothetical protein